MRPERAQGDWVPSVDGGDLDALGGDLGGDGFLDVVGSGRRERLLQLADLDEQGLAAASRCSAASSMQLRTTGAPWLLA